MTNQYFKEIKVHNGLMRALHDAEEYLNAPIKIHITDKAAYAKWQELARRTSEFYELPIEECLIKAGMKPAPKPTEPEDE